MFGGFDVYIYIYAYIYFIIFGRFWMLEKWKQKNFPKWYLRYSESRLLLAFLWPVGSQVLPSSWKQAEPSSFNKWPWGC